MKKGDDVPKALLCARGEADVGKAQVGSEATRSRAIHVLLLKHFISHFHSE